MIFGGVGNGGRYFALREIDDSARGEPFAAPAPTPCGP